MLILIVRLILHRRMFPPHWNLNHRLSPNLSVQWELRASHKILVIIFSQCTGVSGETRRVSRGGGTISAQRSRKTVYISPSDNYMPDLCRKYERTLLLFRRYKSRSFLYLQAITSVFFSFKFFFFYTSEFFLSEHFFSYQRVSYMVVIDDTTG